MKNYIENNQVYDFLVGLNSELDQVRVQILNKELPTLNETISIIRAKKSRSVMLKPQNMEGSTMVTSKGIDQKTDTADNKRNDQSRASNRDNRDNLWSIYYEKARHT